MLWSMRPPEVVVDEADVVGREEKEKQWGRWLRRRETSRQADGRHENVSLGERPRGGSGGKSDFPPIFRPHPVVVRTGEQLDDYAGSARLASFEIPTQAGGTSFPSGDGAQLGPERVG